MKYIFLSYFIQLVYLFSIDSLSYTPNTKCFTLCKHKLHANDDSFNGMDQRHQNISDDMDHNILLSIHKSIYQLQIFQILQDNNVNICTKIELINRFDDFFDFHPKCIGNIYNGGLLKDWNFPMNE